MQLRGFPLSDFTPFFRIWDLISQFFSIFQIEKKNIIQFLSLGSGDFLILLIFFFPEISFLEGAVKMCPVVSPQHSKASTTFVNKAWSGRHQRHCPTHTDRLSVTCFVDRNCGLCGPENSDKLRPGSVS